MYTVERTISAHHPSLAGHFPGNPLVPGVMLLDEILDAFTEWQGPCHLKGISAVKFLAPVLPNQTFRITLVLSDTGMVRFRCSRNDELLVQGQMTITTMNHEWP